MFTLEKSIAEWEKQMLAAGIKTPVPLEELEIHLREEIERRKWEMNEERAFEIAVRCIGKASTLNNEFQKANLSAPKRTISVAMGVYVVFAGSYLILSLVAQNWNEVISLFILSLILPVTLILLGLVLIFYGGGIPSWLSNKTHERKNV